MKKTTAIISFFPLMFVLTTAICYAEKYPEPNPPTEVKMSDSLATQRDIREKSRELRTPDTEWMYHKTADNQHPNGMEQQQLWLVNNARANPTAEGEWLATESHLDVSNGRDFFNVEIAKLEAEFAAIAPMPPAAFDRRLYEAAKTHSEDLISRDAQDHNNQFDRVTVAGFTYTSVGGVVFSYSRTGLHAHAAFNIDWGNEDDGMQTGRGHRVALMSDDRQYFNVGIASLAESDSGTGVGPFVTTGNYAEANESVVNHYNNFIVGTVWKDTDGNGWYDEGEGYAGVRVEPDGGTYYAITSDSGGYAIPITEPGSVSITFSGGMLSEPGSRQVVLADKSVLVDFIPVANNPVLPPSDDPEPVKFPWTMFLSAITGKNSIPEQPDCNGDLGGAAYLDNCNICVGGTTGHTPCTVDCNGVINGTAVVDACGVCGGDGSICEGTFERSGSGYIVTDTHTGLMWQDSQLSFKDEAAAVEYCKIFSLDGYNDWRFPVLDELQLFFRRVAANDSFDLNYWGTFSGCTAAIADGGYVKTPVGAERYGGETGDTIGFSGGAAARCVRE